MFYVHVKIYFSLSVLAYLKTYILITMGIDRKKERENSHPRLKDKVRNWHWL